MQYHQQPVMMQQPMVQDQYGQFVPAQGQVMMQPVQTVFVQQGPTMVAPNSGQWSTGMCGCFEDCGICCYGFFLLPCLYGQNVERLDKTGCCGSCCLYACCATWACAFAGSTRGRLRYKYGLPEDPCSDCCVHFWCSALGVCQEAREIKYRGL